MAFWNRNKTADRPVLPELQQYYDAERRERSGMAWLLALVSVACVALLVIGAFFGGRWVYRTVRDRNDNNVATQNNTPGQQANVPSVDGGPTPNTPPPAPGSAPAPGATPSPGAAPAPGARPNPAPGPSPSPGAAPSPTPNPSSPTSAAAGPQSLPNTGPDSDL